MKKTNVQKSEVIVARWLRRKVGMYVGKWNEMVFGEWEGVQIR